MVSSCWREQHCLQTLWPGNSPGVHAVFCGRAKTASSRQERACIMSQSEAPKVGMEWTGVMRVNTATHPQHQPSEVHMVHILPPADIDLQLAILQCPEAPGLLAFLAASPSSGCLGQGQLWHTRPKSPNPCSLPPRVPGLTLSTLPPKGAGCFQTCRFLASFPVGSKTFAESLFSSDTGLADVHSTKVCCAFIQPGSKCQGPNHRPHRW